MSAAGRLEELIGWFEPGSQVLVALSGGVDSALVAYAAHRGLGAGAVAVTADYKTLSREELGSARTVCGEIGIEHVLVRYDELESEEFARNGPDRCFHCRSALAHHLAGIAARRGVDLVVDGTHAGDLGEYRPGIRALREGGIRSPLAEAGFTKQEVRESARLAGLSVYDKPSNSCLASRIPWGRRVTAERLARIELGETLVRQATGARQVRVRDIGGTARIEVEPGAVPSLRGGVLERISEGLGMIGFSGVEIDKDGYAPGKANVAAD